MATTTVFRVEKNKNYTTISNHHLQDRNLSLKAKGLLTLILSLPPDWDMTLKGLVSLSGDGVDSVRSGIQELEKAGYLRRSRSRNNLGQLLCTEYTIYEHAVTENVASETEIDDNLNIIYSEESHIGKSDVDKNSHIGKSDVDKNTTEKIENSQIGFSNIGKPYIGKSNTIKNLNNKDTNNINNYPYQSTYSSKLCREPKENSIDEMEKAQTLYEERKAYEEIIKQNIAYDLLSEQKETSRDFLDLCVQVMVDAVTSNKPYIKIKGQDIPKEAVKSVLLKLDDENISYVDMCLSESKTAIKNMQSYILTALYCSQHGGDTYFNQLVKHDYA
ncbi:DUF6017 domain-containing protein [Ruminococcus sp.]|uniref:DUF6017 domain-containing protein n=1 Tax=Ruminococcus sp. TaxID=41978 RepID=UPI003FD7BDBF